MPRRRGPSYAAPQVSRSEQRRRRKVHEVTKTALGSTDRIPTVEQSRDTVERKQQYATMTEVNGAKFYYEVRGSGPSVLFIAGATGDGGHLLLDLPHRRSSR
jgi:hypothetical protein